MRRHLLAAFVTVVVVENIASGSAPTQRAGAPAEVGKYRLYKFEQAIGEETYRISRDGDAIVLTDSFSFTDRGSAVPLETTFRGAADLTPRSFESKGKSSRLSTVDVSVRADRDSAMIRRAQQMRETALPKPCFVVNGYSPIAQQMLMLRYWLLHQSPAELPILPQGTSVRILPRGTDDVTIAGKRTSLTRYSVGGLIWGREMVWLDDARRLVAAVTTDAEFDHFEALADGYEPLLGQFVAEAGRDGMTVLAELSQGLRQAPAGPLAILGARVVDGTGRPPIADATIVIENGRIVAVGASGAIAVPAGATLIDARGKTVLPGLWDMHAHFEQVEWGPIYLASGVTTARDVGNELEFISAVRDALRDGRGVGPQLLLAGVVDGTDATALGVARVDSRADADRWVHNYKDAGFQQIKIYGSVKREQVEAICEIAHKAGMTVTGHIPRGIDAYQGVEAGMDQVNHIEYLIAPLAPAAANAADFLKRLESFAAVDPAGADAQREIEFLKRHDTLIDPTLALMELTMNGPDDPVMRFEPDVVKVAPELAAPMASLGVLPADAVLTGRRAFRNMLALVGALHRAGVRVVAGTDQSVPGHSMHREIELYVEAGFTPMEAIQAATIVPAQVMGVAGVVGTIEAGKRADLIVLDANPLDDIHNIRSVRQVIANGILYPTARLWESVGFKP